MRQLRGPSIRLGQVTHIFEYIPPFTMTDMFGVTGHVCGRCFKKLGDDPFNGRPGKMVTGAPKGTRCVFCGGKAWPYE